MRPLGASKPLLAELLDQAKTYLADAKCIAVAKTAQGYGEASGLLLSENI